MARLVFSIALGLVATFSASNAMALPVLLVATQLLVVGGYVAAGWAVAAGVAATLIASNQARREQAAIASRAAAAASASAAASAAGRATAISNLVDRNITGLSSESAWQVVYGYPAPIGGSLVGLFTSGDHEEFKHMVVVFASHPSQAINEVYIDGEPVGLLDSSGWAVGGPFVETRDDFSVTEFLLSGDAFGILQAGRVETTYGQITKVIVAVGDFYDENGQLFNRAVSVVITGYNTVQITSAFLPRYVHLTYTYRASKARVNVQKHLSPNGVDYVDDFLTSKVRYLDTNFRLSGYTYVVVTLDQNLSRFQGGPPNITAQLTGKNTIYDFRDGTRSFKSNPALCLADFIMSEAGYGATLEQFDAASVIAAANACDYASYICAGTFKTDQDRETTKQQLEDCFGGTCHQTGGVWRIIAGSWTSPVMTLNDADCAAPIQITQASYTSKERYNTVRGKYIDLVGLGVAQDFYPWQNPTYVATDGFVKLRDISLPFTSYAQLANNLARMIVERSRGGLTISYPGHMRLWPLQPGDRVSINNTEFGWVNKTFRITDWGFHPKSPVTLTMVEDVAVYYNAAVTITTDVTPNTNLLNPYATENLGGVGANSGTSQLLKQADGTIMTRVYVFWISANYSYVLGGGRVELQTRPALSLDSQWVTTILPGNATSAYLTNQPDGVDILIRARFVNELNIPGLWQTISHFVVGKTEPPPDVTSFTIDKLRLNWGVVNVIDLAGYLIRFNYGQNTWWDGASPLHTGVLTDVPYDMTKRPQGLVTLLIKAVDTSGNQSLNAASIVLNLGDQLVSNLLVTYPQAPAWFSFKDFAVSAPGTYAYVAPKVRGVMRNSAATRINSSGLVEVIAANTPRFNYNASTLALEGLLVEDASSNLLFQSNSFPSVAWSNSDKSLSTQNFLPDDVDTTGFGGSWTPGPNLIRIASTIGPTGGGDAVIYQNNTYGNAYLIKSYAAGFFSASSRYKLAIWAKLVSGTAPTTGQMAIVETDFDNVATTSERVNLGWEGLTTSWKRFFLEFTTGSGAAASTANNVYIATDWANGAQIAFSQPVLVRTQGLNDLSNLTINDPAVAAPDGSFTSVKAVMVRDGLVFRQFLPIPFGVYTPSVWVYYPEGPTRTVTLGDPTSLATAAVSAAPGWQRLTCSTFTKNSNTYNFVDIQAGVLANPIWFWGAQLEPGLIRTSYIVNAGFVPQVRAAETALIIGNINNGSIIDTVLMADAADVFYGPDTEPFYEADGDLYYLPGSYLTMSYIFQVDTSPGLLLLDHIVLASNYTVEYQRDDQSYYYGADALTFKSVDTDSRYALPSAWATWTGAVSLPASEGVRFRITTVAGARQGIIALATVKLDVPDVLENFNDLVIAASGTRLPITQKYRVIENVQITVQANGFGGITARVEDKDPISGPFIRVFDTAGSPVVGLIDVALQGY